MTPRVSVIIPTYNASALLCETLRTVFDQTFGDFEVVVIDDGSTDDTSARLAAIDDPRLRVIRQTNAGIGAARNRGVDEARGELLAFLDHDDLWYPDKLALQVSYLDRTPDAVGCVTQWIYDENPRIEPRPAMASEAERTLENALRVWARGDVFLISSAIMVRRSSLGDLRYQTERASTEDTALQIRLLCRGPFGIVGSRPHMRYRLHPNNYSKNAAFWFNGIRLLLRLKAENYFAECQGEYRRDLDDLLTQFGRVATVYQIRAGLRGRAAYVYGRMFVPNLVRGRLRYLLAAPAGMLWPRLFA